MQAQTHVQSLRPFSTLSTPSHRAAGAGFVIALHVGLVIALIYGLKVTFTPTPPRDLTGGVIIEPTSVKPPPLPPPPPDAIDTTVHIVDPLSADTFPPDTDDGHAITATNGPVAQTLPVRSTPAQGIMSTHTIPPYPPIAVRLNEQGIVTLRVVISEEGFVTDAAVVRSSGYARLDAAAVSWVKSRWRYRPAQAEGRAVASTAQAEVHFELH
jgi:protein TonB